MKALNNTFLFQSGHASDSVISECIARLVVAKQALIIARRLSKGQARTQHLKRIAENAQLITQTIQNACKRLGYIFVPATLQVVKVWRSKCRHYKMQSFNSCTNQWGKVQRIAKVKFDLYNYLTN